MNACGVMVIVDRS